MQSSTVDQVALLRMHLAIIKRSPADRIQNDYFDFMVRAKDTLGEIQYPMAQFYYEYGNFILQKIEANTDIFGQAALPNVKEEQDQQLENISEVYQEDSSYQQPKQQENEVKVKAQEQDVKKEEEDNQPQIEEDQYEYQYEEDDDAEPAENEDDKDICVMNLELAVTIYEQQLRRIRDGDSSTNIDQVYDGIRRARTRLGDLYLNDQNYARSVQYYNKVIELESEREGFESNRLISELYFLIGNAYLYENKPNCELKAITEYIKATNTLLNHLNLILGYDISGFDIPHKEKTKVERLKYMPMPGDSEKVVEIKNVITCLLDKIQDAYGQIGVREAYEREKRKFEEQKNLNQFKPVEEKSKVVNLGSFGNRNRKKMPQQEEQSGLPFKENGEINETTLPESYKQRQSQKKPEG